MQDDFHICIHCHFYQPPRENPWLETIESQDSAAPYHDWNERISAECYRPNGLSRILNDQGWIVRLTNNYARISFNFGPTLLSWMEDRDPAAYQAILDGDSASLQRFSGHGSAIAQAYNHIIMPLASRRDKETQIVWGLRDFEQRFGRTPESMWLPETAVDTETLEMLAAHGMKYVILAPHQAHGAVDTRKPHMLRLPGGKEIAAFFYNGEIARAVAFERLLNNGEHFAHRLMNGFDMDNNDRQLVHIATDGESYGHHHRHGDMALAYALDYIEKKEIATITNYGAYLAQNPPQQEAKILENSSWSCAHGIERWRSDCGCNSGGATGWNQAWRAPLRKAFDMLRDRLEQPYADLMSRHTDDPWAMRDDYIAVVSDRSNKSFAAFRQRWITHDLPDEALLKSLEMQRNLMLMYTSCAWFFDEVSGLETEKNIEYAARAIELARDVFGIDLENEFLNLLEDAPSNIAEIQTGRTVYERYAQSARVDSLKVAAHLAAMLLFKDKDDTGSIYCFDYTLNTIRRKFSGKLQLLCAVATMTSYITKEKRPIDFCAVHWGDHNINIGVRPHTDEASFKAMASDFESVLGGGDMTRTVRLLDTYYSGQLFTLRDLFRDQQKDIISIVFKQTLQSVEDQFVNIYNQYYPLMNYISGLHLPQPTVFSHIARFVQTNTIKSELDKTDFDVSAIHRLIDEARDWGIKLNSRSLEQQYLTALGRQFNRISDHPSDIDRLAVFADLVDLIHVLPFEIDIGPIQNGFSIWGHKALEQPYAESAEWRTLVDRISSILKVKFIQ